MRVFESDIGRKMSGAVAVCAFFLLFGCGSGGSDRVGVFQSTAPVLEGGEGLDSADRDCRVVLRKAERLQGQTGLAVECVDGRCWFVWAAWVDISEELAGSGARPGLLYQAGSDPTWWETREAREIPGEGGSGYRRFEVLFYENIAPAGTSMTSLMGIRIELAVFAHLDGGTRIFDHNRLPGDFENYVLDSGNTWSVAEAPAVCSEKPVAKGLIRFLPGYVHKQHGPIVQGGRVRVEYALSRLAECSDFHDDAPGWDVEIHARFLPGGELYSESIVHFSHVDDNADLLASSKPVEIDVPAGAERVEFWFRNFSESGCESWDSDYGKNYGFDVLRVAPAQPVWAGDWGNGFNRECVHRNGLDEPIIMDSYLMERACLFVDADVYVPGLTDVDPLNPGFIAAQVEISLDDGPWETRWLEFQGRVGNNYRYRWNISREELQRVEWNRIRYAFRFSTDGVHSFRTGLEPGPGGGSARTILRNFHHQEWDG